MAQKNNSKNGTHTYHEEKSAQKLRIKIFTVSITRQLRGGGLPSLRRKQKRVEDGMIEKGCEEKRKSFP